MCTEFSIIELAFFILLSTVIIVWLITFSQKKQLEALRSLWTIQFNRNIHIEKLIFEELEKISAGIEKTPRGNSGPTKEELQ